MSTAPAILEVGFDARLHDDAWVVAVRGQVDSLSVEHVTAVLLASAQGRNRLVVDLSNVEYFGAAGLRAIADVASQVKESGGTVTVRVGSALVERLFEATDVGSLVHLTRAGRDPAASSELPSDGDAPTLLRMLIEFVAPFAHDQLFIAAMTMLARSAQAAIHSVEASSVTINGGGSFVTVAATDPVALELDEVQYASRAGPCVHAATHGHVVHANATTGADSWAAVSAAARDAGIQAVLSTPIMGANAPIGALNLYSSNDKFTDAERAQAFALVTDLAAFVEVQGPPGSHGQDGLNDALTTRELLALAQGMIMERHQISADEAFTELRRESRATARTVREVAEAVISPSTSTEVTSQRVEDPS